MSVKVSLQEPSNAPKPPLADAPAGEPGRMERLLLGLRRGSLAVLAVVTLGLSILLLAWMTLHWGILPRVQHWKPDIEAWASRHAGAPVTIGTISVTGGLWQPMLRLREVRVQPSAATLAGGPPATLRLGDIDAEIAPPSLLPSSLTDWRPSLRSLRIANAQVDIRRDASGQVHLAGLTLGHQAGDKQPALEWLLSQPDIRIEGGRLRWTDALGLNQAVDLTALNLHLTRQGREHRLTLGATPPAELAGPVRVTGVFSHPLLAAVGLGSAGDWRDWQGPLTLGLAQADVRVVQRHIAAMRQAGVQVHSGRVSMTARLYIDRARLSSGDADLQVQDLDARLGPTLEPLRLRELQTHLDWALGSSSRGEQLDRLHATGLRFQTTDPLVWPASDIELRLRRDGDAPWHAGEASASRLDLALLARLARQVPLAGPLRKLIDQTRPAGELLGLRYRWEGPLEQPLRYRYSGEGRRLHLQAAPAPGQASGESPGRPGVQQARLRFAGDERSGHADVEIVDGQLDFPGVFAEPVVPMQQLAAAVQWKVDRPAGEPTALPAVAVTVSKARFRNADASGELSGNWHTGPRPGGAQAASAPVASGSGAYLPGVLDLRVRIDRADARRVHRYLPVRLPESARRYVRDAVRGGTLSEVQARVQGDLADFPFGRERSGTFQIRTRISDGELMALPAPGSEGRSSDWPTLTQLRGELLFDRQSMRVLAGSGRVGSINGGHFAIEHIDARIDDFLLDPVLRLDSHGQGPLDDVLQFMRRTPLDGWLGHALTRTEVQGDARVQLTLQLPFDGRAEVAAGERVRGQIELRGNELLMLPGTPRLQAVRGPIRFSDTGFEFDALQAQALGGAVLAKGGLRADGAVRIEASGRASAAGLRANRELPWLARLATQLEGESDYALKLAFPNGEPDLQIESRLLGMNGLWPAPLAKPADQAWPLTVKVGPSARPMARPMARSSEVAPAISTPGRSEDGATRQWIRVALAGSEAHPAVQALYERELGATAEQDRVLRGAVRVGAGEPVLPERGVQAAIELPLLSVAPWLHWFDHAARPWLDADSAPPAAAVTGAGAPPPPATTATDLPDVVPTRIQLSAGALAYGQRQLHDVQLELVHEPTPRVSARPTLSWTGRIQAQETRGQFSWRQPADGDAQVQVRLARLALPPPRGEAPAAPAASAGSDSPTHRLPDLDLVIDDLQVRGLPLGRLTVLGAHRDRRPGPNPRDWLLQQLSLEAPEAHLMATGQWHAPDAAAGAHSRTELDFRLQLRDGGQFLQRLGQAQVLRDGAGLLSGELHWDGSPLAMDLARVQGTLKLALDHGRFLRADPGAARLLGVLSLQSLPRRLLFDFSDLTQDGFSFDSVSADVSVNAGVASTQNLRIQGLQAAIISQGQADLQRETQDLYVWVVPDVNAGAASLAYAIVNPAVGLGTLLGQLMLRDSLAEAATRELHISGPWTAPKVEELPRQRPTPALPPASAPGAPALRGPQMPFGPLTPMSPLPAPMLPAADAAGNVDSAPRP